MDAAGDDAAAAAEDAAPISICGMPKTKHTLAMQQQQQTITTNFNHPHIFLKKSPMGATTLFPTVLPAFAAAFPALALAVHNEAQRHGLHAPGADAALDVLPEDGGNLVAHEPVEHSSGLLRANQVLVDGARVLQRFFHCAGGDLVELNAADVGVLALDELGHVPADGLALAVRVGREVDVVRCLGGLAQAAHNVLFALDDLVARQVAVLLVQAHVALGKIAHVAHGGLHDIVLAEEFADGLHLCRGLNDDEVFCHDGAGYSHLSTDWQGAGWRLARSGVAGQGAAPGEHPLCTPRSAGSGSSISVGNDLSPCHQ